MPKVNLKAGKTEFQELVTIEEAYKILGSGFSRSAIYRRINSGEWVEGIHWIDDRRIGSQRRIIKINLTQIHQIRAIEAGKR